MNQTMPNPSHPSCTVSTEVAAFIRKAMPNRLLQAVMLKELLPEFKELDLLTILDECLPAKIETPPEPFPTSQGMPPLQLDLSLTVKNPAFDPERVPGSWDFFNPPALCLEEIVQDDAAEEELFTWQNYLNLSSIVRRQYKPVYQDPFQSADPGVVGIWIVPKPWEMYQNTITTEQFQADYKEGKPAKKLDWLRLFRISLGRLEDDQEAPFLVRLLNVLYEPDLSLEEKARRLKELPVPDSFTTTDRSLYRILTEKLTASEPAEK